MFKLNEEYKVLNLIGSTTVTADLNGTAVAVEVYEADALAILSTGLITSTAATYVVNIQGSTASAGTYTTIGSFDSFTASTDGYKVGALALTLDKTDRLYIRAQVDTTANEGTVSAIVGVTLLVRPTTAQSGLNSTDIA